MAANGDSAVLPSEFIIVLVTTSSEEEATLIGRAVVQEGLAACANIVALKKSIFLWEGKLSEEQEFLVIMKSKSDLFPQLSQTVRRLHSYTVPEIIATPIIAGSHDYLDWVRGNTCK